RLVLPLVVVVVLVVLLVVLVVLVVVVVLVVFVVFVVLVVLVVGVSRRQRVAHDGDEAPVDQPTGNVLEVRRGHVASCLDVATFATGPYGTATGAGLKIGRAPAA